MPAPERPGALDPLTEAEGSGVEFDFDPAEIGLQPTTNNLQLTKTDNFPNRQMPRGFGTKFVSRNPPYQTTSVMAQFRPEPMPIRAMRSPRFTRFSSTMRLSTVGIEAGPILPSLGKIR